MKDNYDFSNSKPWPGVAKVDASKHSNVISARDRTFDDLLNLKRDYAEAALARPPHRTAFGYGFACGYYQALVEAIAIFERHLNEGPSSRTSREES